MFSQQIPGRCDALQHRRFGIARTQLFLHQLADSAPLFGTDEAIEATVGEDLDPAFGKQQIYQDAVVFSGIPDMQSRKRGYGTGAGIHATPQRNNTERRLHGETDFATMSGLVAGDSLGDPGETGRRKQRTGRGRDPMLKPSFHRHLTSAPKRRRHRCCRLPQTNRWSRRHRRTSRHCRNLRHC